MVEDYKDERGIDISYCESHCVDPICKNCGGTIIPRRGKEEVLNCWKTKRSEKVCEDCGQEEFITIIKK